jgi:hypothetical protein
VRGAEPVAVERPESTAAVVQVEAVMDRIKDNISLDHLSRLLVDVHIDSSTIVDSTLSAYQRRLLNLVFNGDAESRDKVRVVKPCACLLLRARMHNHCRCVCRLT